MRIRTHLLLLTIALALPLALSSCSSTTSSNPPNNTPKDTTHGISYTLRSRDMRPLRSNESYVLWLSLIGQNAVQKVEVLKIDPGKLHDGDSLTFTGVLPSLDSIPNIDQLLVSVEADTSVTSPGSVILFGNRVGTGEFELTPFTQSAVAELRPTSGSAVFTTLSGDTLQAKHEFYLMNLLGVVASQSLESLPNLGHGWMYAVWVTDSTFVPAHLFYYGAFLHPSGHDSDSTHDSYAYPGGFGPPSLDRTQSKIEVTIEPEFQLPSLRMRGPSTFIVLVGMVPKHVSMGTVVPLANVTERGLPSGHLSIEQH